MAASNEIDIAFGFNHPTYCDWKVTIQADGGSATVRSVDDIEGEAHSAKRQKSGNVDAIHESRTFLVSAVILGKHSEFFRSVYLSTCL